MRYRSGFDVPILKPPKTMNKFWLSLSCSRGKFEGYSEVMKLLNSIS